MIVKVLARLKNGSEIIDVGTTFEGDEKTLPDFIVYELNRKRGTVEVLPEPKKVRKYKIKPPAKAVKKAEPTEKVSALRKKITDSEK